MNTWRYYSNILLKATLSVVGFHCFGPTVMGFAQSLEPLPHVLQLERSTRVAWTPLLSFLVAISLTISLARHQGRNANITLTFPVIFTILLEMTPLSQVPWVCFASVLVAIAADWEGIRDAAIVLATRSHFACLSTAASPYLHISTAKVESWLLPPHIQGPIQVLAPHLTVAFVSLDGWASDLIMPLRHVLFSLLVMLQIRDWFGMVSWRHPSWMFLYALPIAGVLASVYVPFIQDIATYFHVVALVHRSAGHIFRVDGGWLVLLTYLASTKFGLFKSIESLPAPAPVSFLAVLTLWRLVSIQWSFVRQYLVLTSHSNVDRSEVESRCQGEVVVWSRSGFTGRDMVCSRGTNRMQFQPVGSIYVPVGWRATLRDRDGAEVVCRSSQRDIQGAFSSVFVEEVDVPSVNPTSTAPSSSLSPAEYTLWEVQKLLESPEFGRWQRKREWRRFVVRAFVLHLTVGQLWWGDWTLIFSAVGAVGLALLNKSI